MGLKRDHDKNMLISHSGFDKKIINKYQKRRKNPFEFPLMIFKKLANYRIPHRKIVHMSVQVSLRNINIQPSFSVGGYHHIQKLFSWFGSEKIKKAPTLHKLNTLIHREGISGSRLTVLKNFTNKVAQAKFIFLTTEKMILTLTNDIKRLFLKVHAGFFYSHTISDTLVQSSISSHWLFNNTRSTHRLINKTRSTQILDNRLEGIKSPGLLKNKNRYFSTQQKNVRENYLILGCRTSAILPQVNVSLNKRLPQESFHQSVNQIVRNYYRNIPRADPIISGTLKKESFFNSSSAHLYFRKQPTINEEVEKVKNVVIETKQAILENSRLAYPSVQDEIRKHLDIHRLSEQVYKNIEQSIRIERERRGL
jgi:hypothetical protein